ncbi:MAG: hypothetical protein JRE40_11025, partial [Deltaproteobacteria bacterium]|nr:hypothetical protein [Deltaproteobacteria bacterium]
MSNMSNAGGIPGLSRRNISAALVNGTEDEKVLLAGELNQQLDEIYAWISLLASATGGTGSGTIAPGDGKFVLHGDSIPPSLTEADLHRNMTGADLHWPKQHAIVTHPVGESDALSVGVPFDVGTVNAEGSANNYCRRDHIHAGLQNLFHEDPVGAINDVNAEFTIDSGLVT